tara:strand:+ start:782 stop:1204 length:423 start_codon:yes stop_codon:yes gene_type:complete
MMAEKIKSPTMAPGEKTTPLKPPTSEKEAMERAIKRMQAREAAKKERIKPKKMGGGSLSYGKMKMAGGGMVDDMKAAGFKMADGGKMPMDPKTGKPTFVGDGKGKMMDGGMAYGKKKMMGGGSMARGSGAARPQKFGKNG